jgi:hypothetical protein
MILIDENKRTRRIACPSANLSTTNPTWTDPGANPGFRGERPATERLKMVQPRYERTGGNNVLAIRNKDIKLRANSNR